MLLAGSTPWPDSEKIVALPNVLEQFRKLGRRFFNQRCR